MSTIPPHKGDRGGALLAFRLRRQALAFGRAAARLAGFATSIANAIRERRARKRLAEIVAQTRASFECERYRRNRAAQLKGRAR